MERLFILGLPELYVQTPVSVWTLTFGEAAIIIKALGLVDDKSIVTTSHGIINDHLPKGVILHGSNELRVPHISLRRQRYATLGLTPLAFLLLDGISYGFTARDLRWIHSSQLNPYTGRPLPPQFLESLSIEVAPCAKLSRSLSAETRDWIIRYVNGALMFKYAHPYPISPQVVLELRALRPETPQRLYRGMRTSYGNTETFATADIGSEFLYQSQVPHSWTTELEATTMFIGKSHNIILTLVPRLEDILVDLNLLPHASFQQEVILLPGSYATIVYSRVGS